MFFVEVRMCGRNMVEVVLEGFGVFFSCIGDGVCSLVWFFDWDGGVCNGLLDIWSYLCCLLVLDGFFDGSCLCLMLVICVVECLRFLVGD